MSSSKDKLGHASFQFISVNQSIVSLKRAIITKQWTTINRNLNDILSLNWREETRDKLAKSTLVRSLLSSFVYNSGLWS